MNLFNSEPHTMNSNTGTMDTDLREENVRLKAGVEIQKNRIEDLEEINNELLIENLALKDQLTSREKQGLAAATETRTDWPEHDPPKRASPETVQDGPQQSVMNNSATDGNGTTKVDGPSTSSRQKQPYSDEVVLSVVDSLIYSKGVKKYKEKYDTKKRELAEAREEINQLKIEIAKLKLLSEQHDKNTHDLQSGKDMTVRGQSALAFKAHAKGNMNVDFSPTKPEPDSSSAPFGGLAAEKPADDPNNPANEPNNSTNDAPDAADTHNGTDTLANARTTDVVGALDATGSRNAMSTQDASETIVTAAPHGTTGTPIDHQPPPIPPPQLPATQQPAEMDSEERPTGEADAPPSSTNPAGSGNGTLQSNEFTLDE